MRRLTSDERAIGVLLYPERNYWRPTTRDDCANVQRPCPYVACRHNLYLDISPCGENLRFYNAGLEPWDILPTASCSLDLADRGRMTLEDIGAAMGVTRERSRQMENTALAKMRKSPEGREALRALAASHKSSHWDEVG